MLPGPQASSATADEAWGNLIRNQGLAACECSSGWFADSAKWSLKWCVDSAKRSLIRLHFVEGLTLFRTEFDELVAHKVAN